MPVIKGKKFGEQKVAVFNQVEFDNHEQVVFCSDKESGLKAIIAVHSTKLGPAVCGCRMWDYSKMKTLCTMYFVYQKV
jgi:leucine dehydrogenase